MFRKNMSWTVLDVQKAIASEVDQSSSPPEQGGEDWNIRLNLINRSLIDWSETYDWRSQLKIFNGIISTSTGNASLVLPSNFRKLDGFPQITWDGSNTDEFTPVDASKGGQYVDTDKVVYILGNPTDGQTMFIRGGTLSSGASVQFTYFSSPASLASASNVIPIPDPTFLVQKTLYYLYKGREDGRFPEAKSESDKILSRLIENENTFGQSHNDNRISNWNQSRYGFRIGRD